MSFQRGNIIKRAFNEKKSLKGIIKGLLVMTSFIITNILINFKLYNNSRVRSVYFQLYTFAKRFTDREKFNLINKNITNNFTFLDIGAALGLYVDYVAERLKRFECGVIYALEPDPISLLFLNDVLRKHKDVNIKIIKCAAWNKEEIIKFYICSQNLGENSASQSDVHNIEIEVNGRPIDSILDASQNIDLIKMDIQGAELKAIQGMGRVLEGMKRGAQIIMECSPDDLLMFDSKPHELISSLEHSNFEIYNELGVKINKDYFNKHTPNSFRQEDLICVKN